MRRGGVLDALFGALLQHKHKQDCLFPLTLFPLTVSALCFRSMPRQSTDLRTARAQEVATVPRRRLAKPCHAGAGDVRGLAGGAIFMFPLNVSAHASGAQR